LKAFYPEEDGMTKKTALYILLCLIFLGIPGTHTHAQDAQSVVNDSFKYMRGKTSVSTVVMTIHRPDWQRTMTIKAWTKGEKESIFWITAPPKDKGNGTLKKKNEMWIYNPKVNRIIKLPPSMMSQAWQGSDFSNNDLSKTDSIINNYSHTIIGTETHEGKKVYLIKSMPKPEAPVIWGMQKLKIREDHIFLEQAFFDEDLQPVKTMTTSLIQKIGGKLFPVIWKMQKNGVKDEYTILEYEKISFDETLPNSLFALSSLRTPTR
jgi:outer membrane lipoprotein-sorting protein